MTEPDAWIITGWDSSEPDGGRIRLRHTGEVGRTAERLDERRWSLAVHFVRVMF